MHCNSQSSGKTTGENAHRFTSKNHCKIGSEFFLKNNNNNKGKTQHWKKKYLLNFLVEVFFKKNNTLMPKR